MSAGGHPVGIVSERRALGRNASGYPGGPAAFRHQSGPSLPIFEALAERLDVPTGELARTIDVPLRTLQRRKLEGVFQPDESDRLFRVLRLSGRAEEVLGTSGATWLTTPKRFLGGATPLAFADTEAGAWEVMQALGRLEHGVFL